MVTLPEFVQQIGILGFGKIIFSKQQVVYDCRIEAAKTTRLA